MMTRIFATLSLVAVCAVPVLAGQRDGHESPLIMARDLYASARYDEALVVLNGLRPADDGPLERKSIEQYRSLCLLALGRGTEAEAAIAAVVTADPLFQPSETEASPRVRTAFSDVRQRLLPEIASVRYPAAKASFDRREFALAERQFRDLVALLEDPQMQGRLSDLRVLATGFLELSAAAAASPPPPTPPPTPAPVAAPEPRPEEPGPSAVAAPAVAPVRVANRVYTLDDPDVTPPVAVRQDLPRVPSTIMAQTRPEGLLDLEIDEQGRVTSMTLRASLHPHYDTLLLSAAREWKYQPARVNGAPVKFRKLIRVAVERR